MTYYAKPSRLVVLGDVHGDVEKLAACLVKYGIINAQQEWIVEPRDTMVVQLGDQVDSGSRLVDVGGAGGGGAGGVGGGGVGGAGGGGAEAEDDWELYTDISVILFLEELDRKAQAHGGRVISLIGNHEIMNSLGDFHMASQKSIDRCGGPERRAALFAPGGDIARILSNRPAIIRVGDILMCHAGILARHVEAVGGDLTRINQLASDYFAGRGYDTGLFAALFLEPTSLVWTRAYSTTEDAELEPEIDQIFRVCGARHVIVGHTVVPNIVSRLGTKVWFADVGYSRAFGNNNLQVIDIWKN